MAEGRHFEIVKSPYLSEKPSDFNEIWYITADIELDASLVTILKIAFIASEILYNEAERHADKGHVKNDKFL